MLDLTGRTAIITGGGSGIGRATALALASKGARVVAADIQPDATQDTVGAIQAAGGEATAVIVDVTRPDSVSAMANQAVARYGAVDILVTCAGTMRDARLERLSEAHWDQVLDVNLKGTFLAIQAVAPVMKERNWGRIVTVASIAHRGNFGQANYSASKGGVVSLTRTAALELAGRGVTVNCVVPGMIDTPLLAGMKPSVREAIAAKIPVGRIGQPDELAGAILFLASDMAAYITGAVLDFDGGLTVGVAKL